MLKISKLLMLICVICSIGLISSCVSVKHVERKQYLLNVKTKEIPHTPSKAFDLEIYQTTAIAPFDQLSFLYRISDTQYTTDYYHSFITSPTQQLTQLFANYLYATQHIKQLPAKSHDYKVYSKLTKLYADYRDRNHPKATVAMHILLVKKSASAQKVLLSKNFQVDVPINEKNSESLLNAWNIAVTKLLRIEAREIVSSLK